MQSRKGYAGATVLEQTLEPLSLIMPMAVAVTQNAEGRADTPIS